MRNRKNQGFTLIELLIVIIVLGILAAIVVFAVANTRKDSVASACKADFRSMELSAEAANTTKGKYPPNANGLLSSGTDGGILKRLPDSADYAFTYASVTPFSSYTITVGAAGTVVGGTDPKLACAPKP